MHPTLQTWIAQATGTQDFLVSLVPLVLIFAIFWFILIRPMRQRQKKLEELVDNLKRGDKVITNGGLYGEVSAIHGNVIHLKVADNTRVRVAKSAIAGLEGDSEGESQ